MTNKDVKLTTTNSTPPVTNNPPNSPGRAEPSKRPAGGNNYQSHGSRSHSASKDKSGPNTINDKPRPRPTPQEARQTYYKWLERLEARALEEQETKERLDSTRELANSLEEPNILAVYRLVEIFGRSLIEGKVERAITLHKEAKEQGAAAYKPGDNPRATRPEHRMVGTEVATAKGEPRTPGGIFSISCGAMSLG